MMPVLDEQEFDTSMVRLLRAMDASPWIGDGLAYWLEWNHPGELSRLFSSTVNDLREQRWDYFIKPGSTCIDIGAHSGDTTIAMGLFSYDRKAGNKGAVVAVEPNPDLRSILSACLTLNSHIAKFHLETCAITEQDVDEITLSDHGNSNCNGGIIGDLSPFLKATLEQTAKVTYNAPGRSLRTLIEKYAVPGRGEDIRFVKTDCEGYDKQIIRGAKDILNQVKPVVFAEWFAWFTPEDDDAFFASIEEVGYVPLHPRTLEPINRLQRTSDVTCIHKSRLTELLP